MSESLYWRRASGCESGHCVSVAVYPNAVYVRSTKFPCGPVLHYTAEEWRAELTNIAGVEGAPFGAVVRTDDGTWQWERNGMSLWFTDDEMDVFVKGVDAGEFDLPEVTA